MILSFVYKVNFACSPIKNGPASFFRPMVKKYVSKKNTFFLKLGVVREKVMEKADYLIFPLEALKKHFDKLYKINKKL